MLRCSDKSCFDTGVIEKINICMKLAEIAFLVTNENMGLCLYIYALVRIMTSSGDQ